MTQKNRTSFMDVPLPFFAITVMASWILGATLLTSTFPWLTLVIGGLKV